MSELRYALTCLTNGRRTCLERSIHAFFQHARPLPASVYVFDDGGQTGGEFVQATISDAVARWAPEWERKADMSVGVYDSSLAPLGMCGAYKNCWDAAAGSEHEWAFHLEDDQVLLRPLHLPDLAAVLDAEATVAQMALVRCPWGREVEHGGYIPQFPGLYERRETWIPEMKPQPESGLPNYSYRAEWIATRRNWATSPALIRTALLREFACPAEAGCETAIGPAILAARPDAVFGLWGHGEPHVAHVGVERQPGAWGY